MFYNVKRMCIKSRPFSWVFCNNISQVLSDIAILLYEVLESKLPIKDILYPLIAPNYLFIYSLSV